MAVRLPGNAEARSEVAGRRTEWRWKRLHLIPDTGNNGHTSSRPPLILYPRGNGIGTVASVRITEALDKHVRRTGRKCIEAWEDENACKPVCKAGIERDMLNRGAEADLVMAT